MYVYLRYPTVKFRTEAFPLDKDLLNAAFIPGVNDFINYILWAGDIISKW